MAPDSCEIRIIHQELVERAKMQDLQEEGLQRLAMLCKILAEPTRLRMLHALLHQEMCVCDLAAFLGSSESAVSHQLRHLRHAGIVDRRREKTVLYYRVIDDQLKLFLTTACQQFHKPAWLDQTASSLNKA
ncbi:MAG: transcriptional regulator [Desulfobacterales bacterium]|nr:MAG: transcriptional regulator [Desulfobacterales bacterium]